MRAAGAGVESAETGGDRRQIAAHPHVTRVQALTVQDRVIRLEERLRLRQLLPPDLHPHIDSLTHRQLVALRFASDAEIADLVREVVGGACTTQKEIKQRVKSWKPDWLRA